MHPAMAAIRPDPCSILLRPLRLGTSGGTFATRRQAPAKQELRETSMAATRIDCDIPVVIDDGERLAKAPYVAETLPVHIEDSYVIIET